MCFYSKPDLIQLEREIVCLFFCFFLIVSRFCIKKKTKQKAPHIFSNRLHWKSELNTYRVEASWKLGQWHLLEDYLSSGN